jgi:hypothetical protein
MTVQELIEKLNKFNPETVVLGEFDMDGDQFMVKVDIDEVYEVDEGDDLLCFDEYIDYDEELENTMFCIIKLDN